jgi:Lon protease-like protein
VLIPLFPLNVVLLPGTRLPLHIFEERYKEMIGEAIRDQTVFGVVLAIDRGVVNLGCTARIERVLEEAADGQMDILTMGESRFEIGSLNQERNFLQGEVTFFVDAESEAPSELRERAIATFRQAFPAEHDDWPFPVDFAHPQLSFQLAQGIPELEFKQQLLATRSEPVRLRKLEDFFPGHARRRAAAEQIKKVAHTNGHGRHYPPSNS